MFTVARRVRGRLASVVVVLLLGLALPPAGAQGVHWSPRLQLDNDAYNFWMTPGSRSDDQYTNGVVLTLETTSAPWWGRRFAPRFKACADSSADERECLATSVSLAQDIYTPDLSHPPYSEPNWQDERPYAAWLRVSGTGRIVSAAVLREFGVAAGVTGPPALGSVFQSVAHSITRAYTIPATGWGTQVGFQPGLQASYQQSWLVARSQTRIRERDVFYDLVPFAGGSLGDILTQAGAGGTARVGINLSHPWDPRAWRGRKPWEFLISASARRQYVLRDFSLDGTLLNPDRHVDRVPGVCEYGLGAELRVQGVSFTYRMDTRSREYTTGPAHHTYSSMIASVSR